MNRQRSGLWCRLYDLSWAILVRKSGRPCQDAVEMTVSHFYAIIGVCPGLCVRSPAWMRSPGVWLVLWLALWELPLRSCSGSSR